MSNERNSREIWNEIKLKITLNRRVCTERLLFTKLCGGEEMQRRPVLSLQAVSNAIADRNRSCLYDLASAWPSCHVWLASEKRRVIEETARRRRGCVRGWPAWHAVRNTERLPSPARWAWKAALYVYNESWRRRKSANLASAQWKKYRNRVWKYREETRLGKTQAINENDVKHLFQSTNQKMYRIQKLYAAQKAAGAAKAMACCGVMWKRLPKAAAAAWRRLSWRRKKLKKTIPWRRNSAKKYLSNRGVSWRNANIILGGPRQCRRIWNTFNDNQRKSLSSRREEKLSKKWLKGENAVSIIEMTIYRRRAMAVILAEKMQYYSAIWLLTKWYGWLHEEGVLKLKLWWLKLKRL